MTLLVDLLTHFVGDLIYTKVTELPELVKVFDYQRWILEKNSRSGIDTLVTRIYTVVGNPFFRFKLTGSAESWYTAPPGRGGVLPYKIDGDACRTF